MKNVVYAALDLLSSIFFNSVHTLSGKPNSLHDTEEGEEDGKSYFQRMWPVYPCAFQTFKHLFQNIYIKNKKNFSKQHWVNLSGSKYIWYSICSSPFEREGRVEVLKSKVKVYHDETQNSSPALPYQKSQVKKFQKVLWATYFWPSQYGSSSCFTTFARPL